jgi:hypothetical protein
MYLASIILLMAVFPIASIRIEAYLRGSPDLLFLIGKWFVFWGVGVRLALAGLKQISNPSFTAETIFGIKDPRALIVVQELGFANLSIGLLGLLSLRYPEWVMAAAITGGLFYGLTGFKHLTKGDRKNIENIAMISDLWIFAVLAAYIIAAAVRSAS